MGATTGELGTPVEMAVGIDNGAIPRLVARV